MNSTRTLGLALILSSLIGAAYAQPSSAAAPAVTAISAAEAPGLTRAQVYAELQRARRDGDILTESGQTEAELNPARYPQHAQASGLTRAQVYAELVRAQRDGDILTESGETVAELNPLRYPHPAQGQALTRAQVLAELDRARRDGDLLTENGETEAHRNPAFYAAQRVRDGQQRFAWN